MTFNTSIIIEEIIIKKNEEEIPFEWTYSCDSHPGELFKTKELELKTLKIKDFADYAKSETSSFDILNFLAIKKYIVPAQPIGNNPRVLFDDVPWLIASKLARVYFENFLENTSLELKTKKQ